jgi:DNA-binding CsgD family transcriptional regulator
VEATFASNETAVIGRTTDDPWQGIPKLRGNMETVIGSVRCPLLIGRDDLLELADRRLDDVVAGRGQFLLVAGEAGIGKTRFLDAVHLKASERGFVSAGGYVAPQDSAVPAASILDLARSMIRAPHFAEPGRALLALRESTVDAEHVRRRQLVTDIVDQLLSAITRPTLLVFEDLQWTDELSLEIIADLARRSRDRTLLLAAGYRSDEAPTGTSLRDWRSRLLTQRLAEEVRLTPLTEAETALVTTLILDSGLPAPRDVAAAVYERTDGIPLHIEELLGALSAEARANGTAIREATVPDTIEDAVLARLGHRSPQAQAVARAGAIIGRCFVPEVLAGIMDLPPESLDEPIQELIDNFVLDPPEGRGLIDFRHQLLRDAIYRSVPVADRRRFHARAGEFGTQLEGQSEIHSSLHFERAGLRRPAFEAALAGARDAARLSAHREAFDLYRRAVANMPKELGPAERADVLAAYGTEALAIEENELAAQAARDSADAYRAAGDDVRAVEAMVPAIAAQRRDLAPVSERIRMLNDLLAELPPPGNERSVELARGNALTFRAIAEIDGGQFDAARESLATAARIAERFDDHDLRTVCEWKSAVIAVANGELAAGIARIGAVALEAERGGDESTGVSAFRDAATLSAANLDYGAADGWIEHGLRYADSIEQSFCAHVMSATSAISAWAGADWEAATSAGRQAVADRGCRRAAQIAHWALGYVALGRGDLDRAIAELAPAWETANGSGEADMTLPPLWGLAESDLLAGNADAAWTRCRAALAVVAGPGQPALLVPFIVTGVRAAQLAGRPGDAAGWIRHCEELVAAVPEVAQPALEHARGLIALADGATGVARTALEAAIAGWDAKGRIWEATWARLDLATCDARAGRFADALALAVEARAVASRLDSRPLAERADALQRLARGRVSAEEPWRPLTAREFSVARLISEGMTNAEIADSLGIAPKTASSHVEHILAKLGASRRAEIATWASNVERSPSPH